jgi:hypothetical protein
VDNARRKHYNRSMRRRIATFIPLILVLAASGCGRGSLFDYLSNPVRPPFANPASGIYNNPVQVWFNPSTRDDRLVIYYTLDPDLPIGDLGAWNQYDYMNGNGIPVAVGEPATIRTFSYISELEFSDVEAYQYSFRPQPRLLAPPGKLLKRDFNLPQRLPRYAGLLYP